MDGYNVNCLIAFFVFTIFVVIAIIQGVYKDTLNETNMQPMNDPISFCQKLSTYHSVIEIFTRFNRNVPRIVASLLVYTRWNMLFVFAGRCFMEGYSTGNNVGTLFGTSICLNIIGKLLYVAY
jgi:hypothetical protein